MLEFDNKVIIISSILRLFQLFICVRPEIHLQKNFAADGWIPLEI